MELKMKEICGGRKTKNDVVHESLEQYREVFVKTTQQIEVLKEVGFQMDSRQLYSLILRICRHVGNMLSLAQLDSIHYGNRWLQIL